MIKAFIFKKDGEGYTPDGSVNLINRLVRTHEDVDVLTNQALEKYGVPEKERDDYLVVCGPRTSAAAIEFVRTKKKIAVLNAPDKGLPGHHQDRRPFA